MYVELDYLLMYLVVVTVTSLVALILLGGKLLPCFDGAHVQVS